MSWACPIEVFTNVNADAYIYNESSGMKPGHPMRYRTAKSDVYGYVGELLAKASVPGRAGHAAHRAPTSIGCWPSWRTGADRRRVQGLRLHRQHQPRTTARTRARPGPPGIELAPVPSLSDVFASGVGEYFSFEFEFDQAMLMFQPVGGMDQIPRALTGAIGAHRVRLGCQATKIAAAADGVTVEYADASGRASGRSRADYCIAAMPPHLLAKLPHNLGTAVQKALTSITPASASKIGLEYKSRWWETDHRIYGGITETDLDLTHIWHPSYGFHGERGVMIGYYNYDDTPTCTEDDARPARGARAVSSASGSTAPSTVPSSPRPSPSPGATSRTSRAPGTTCPDNSPDAAVLRPLVNPIGRVLYAGDWLSYMDAWQHGAILSARKAVTTLHTRALSV